MIKIQSPLADIKDANTMARFEEWAKAKGYAIGKVVIMGKFDRYFDVETDNAWLGYCAATVQCRNVTMPIVRELLSRQCGHLR